MLSLTSMFFSLLACITCGLFACLTSVRSSDSTMRRLHAFSSAGLRDHAELTGHNRRSRLIIQFATWIRTHLGLQEQSGLGARIARSGYRGIVAVDLYTAVRLAGPLAAIILAVVISGYRVPLIITLPPIAYITPDLLLEYMIRRRQRAIHSSLPDVIDLLVICVDAGLGIDQAMMRVAHEMMVCAPQLRDELMQVNNEHRAGKPRLEAWLNMAKRLQLAEIDSFVSMLVQTERFGTPIAKALSSFASGLRLKRLQLAEEKAAQTTVKIIFPLVLFIFPCLFIILIGPAAIIMLHSF